MPYTKDLNNGEMIYHPVTGTAMHIDVFTAQTETAAAEPVALILGHSPITGHRMTAEHSAALWVTECLTDQTRVTYHGSLTDVHGPAMVFESCPCDSCLKSTEDHYRLILTGDRSGEMHHVRRASFTVETVHCAHCYALRCAAERQPAA